MTTTQLTEDLYYAGRLFVAGTVIEPLTAPASGGYFFAKVELSGRGYVISVRDADVTELDAPAELADATPQQIDTVLAHLYELEAKTLAYLQSAQSSVYRAIGQRPTWMGRRQVYTMPFSDALAIAQAMVAAPGYVRGPQNAPGDVVGALEHLAKYEAELAELDAAQKPLHEEYARRPWSRFFWVQNNGGHVHSSMNCSTCNKGATATSFGWNPDLSGLTEADAVAKLGPTLCTVCFPSAPVEHTRGVDKGHCPGSGQPAVDGTRKRYGRSYYGECSGCHTTQTVLTSNYAVRAHKPPKSAK